MTHQPAACSGSHDHPENHPSACAVPIRGLGQGKTVGVVGHTNRTAQGSDEIAIQGPAVEHHRVGVLDQTGSG